MGRVFHTEKPSTHVFSTKNPSGKNFASGEIFALWIFRRKHLGRGLFLVLKETVEWNERFPNLKPISGAPLFLHTGHTSAQTYMHVCGCLILGRCEAMYKRQTSILHCLHARDFAHKNYL